MFGLPDERADQNPVALAEVEEVQRGLVTGAQAHSGVCRADLADAIPRLDHDGSITRVHQIERGPGVEGGMTLRVEIRRQRHEEAVGGDCGQRRSTIRRQERVERPLDGIRLESRDLVHVHQGRERGPGA